MIYYNGDRYVIKREEYLDESSKERIRDINKKLKKQRECLNEIITDVGLKFIMDNNSISIHPWKEIIKKLIYKNKKAKMFGLIGTKIKSKNKYNINRTIDLIIYNTEQNKKNIIKLPSEIKENFLDSHIKDYCVNIIKEILIKTRKQDIFNLEIFLPFSYEFKLENEKVVDYIKIHNLEINKKKYMLITGDIC